MRISDWSSDVCSSDLIEEARGLYHIQAAERLPTLGATADVTRSRTPGAVTGIPEVGPSTGTRYSVGVGVTGFELDFWGRVRNLSEAARSQYFATIEAQRAFRLTLIRDVASTYFASREADERIALAEETVRSEKRSVGKGGVSTGSSRGSTYP